MQKPAVIRYVYEQIRAQACFRGEHEFSHKFAYGIFKTDSRRHLDVAVRQTEHCTFVSSFKITRYLIAYNSCEQRHRMPTRAIFAEPHQVTSPIDLHSFA